MAGHPVRPANASLYWLLPPCSQLGIENHLHSVSALQPPNDFFPHFFFLKMIPLLTHNGVSITSVKLDCLQFLPNRSLACPHFVIWGAKKICFQISKQTVMWAKWAKAKNRAIIINEIQPSPCVWGGGGSREGRSHAWWIFMLPSFSKVL